MYRRIRTGSESLGLFARDRQERRGLADPQTPPNTQAALQDPSRPQTDSGSVPATLSAVPATLSYDMSGLPFLSGSRALPLVLGVLLLLFSSSSSSLPSHAWLTSRMEYQMAPNSDQCWKEEEERRQKSNQTTACMPRIQGTHPQTVAFTWLLAQSPCAVCLVKHTYTQTGMRRCYNQQVRATIGRGGNRQQRRHITYSHHHRSLTSMRTGEQRALLAYM